MLSFLHLFAGDAPLPDAAQTVETPALEGPALGTDPFFDVLRARIGANSSVEPDAGELSPPTGNDLPLPAHDDRAGSEAAPGRHTGSNDAE